ncbi:MAG: TonB-dependent hemoglobin/transferrin/lactoferrin family receptor [Hyphomicrobiaceae bacterium]
MSSRVHWTRCAGASLFAAVLATAPAALAQSTTEEETAAGTGTVLDPITVTASRQSKQVLDVPATVTVIGQEQLEEQQTRDTQDLVRYVPGVVVDRQTSGTNPARSYTGFTIRGVSGNRVQMQVDGFRVQERITDGTRDFIDISTLKEVEIVRGPGSVLWGADALGGIVAYRTLDPQDLLSGKDKPWAVRLNTGFDSFDSTFSKSVALAGKISPTLEALAVINQKTSHEPKLSNARADGGIWGCPLAAPTAFRYLPCNKFDPMDTSSWNVLTKVVWRPNADHTVKLTGEYFDKDTDINQLWDFGVVGSGGVTNGPYEREQVLSRQRISLSHEWNVRSALVDSIRWQLGYSPQKRELSGDRLQTLGNGDLRRTLSTLDFSEKFLQADVQLTSRLNFAGARHTFTYGFQGDHTKSDYFREDVATNLNTGVTTVTRAGGFNFANATTTRADGYIQDEIALFGDRLTITPGVRYATYNLDPRPDADYKPVPGAEPHVIKSERWIPQIGAILKVTDVTSLYARYAEGFKMPTAEQLFISVPAFNLVPNPDLRPESVRSYEGGVRFRFARGNLSVGAFHADYTDFIQSFVPIPNTVNISYANLSAVTVRGVEVSGQYQFTDNLRGYFSASAQTGTQVASAGASRTPFDGVSPLNGVFGLNYRIPNYNIELEGVALAAAGVDRASTAARYKPDGYAAFDAFVTWRPLDNVTLRGGVLNIFDTRYFPSSVVSGYNQTPTCSTVSNCVSATNPLELQVAPGRTFRVGLQVDF